LASGPFLSGPSHYTFHLAASSVSFPFLAASHSCSYPNLNQSSSTSSYHSINHRTFSNSLVAIFSVFFLPFHLVLDLLVLTDYLEVNPFLFSFMRSCLFSLFSNFFKCSPLLCQILVQICLILCWELTDASCMVF
jgi:hypothetical protein